MRRLSFEEKDLSTKSLIAFVFSFIVVELYFVSPIYFIIKYNNRYIKKRHLPIYQIFINLLNCSTYVIIALKGTGDFQNFLTNIIGVTLCLIVILELWLALSKRKNSNYILPTFLICNCIFQLYYCIFKIGGGDKTISKALTIIINICMYSSLNIGVYYAFKEKKADRIPLLSAILGLLSSIGWTTYSIAVESDEKNKEKKEGKVESDSDIITKLSNAISIIVLVIPIISYIYIAKKYKNNTSTNNLPEKNSEKNKIDLENKEEEEGNDD